MSQLLFRFLLLILLFLISAVGVLPQKQPARWLYVAMSGDGWKFYRLDKIDRLENGNPAIWSRTLSYTGYYRHIYYEWNCQDNRFRTLQNHYFSPEDKMLENKQPIFTGWLFPPPDSIAELLFDIACKPPVAPKIVEIKVIRANLRVGGHPQAIVMRTAEKGERFQLSMGKSIGSWFNIVDEETQADYWIHRSVFEFIE